MKLSRRELKLIHEAFDDAIRDRNEFAECHQWCNEGRSIRTKDREFLRIARQTRALITRYERLRDKIGKWLRDNSTSKGNP